MLLEFPSMTENDLFDVIVVGAGIVGAAIAERLMDGPFKRGLLIEKEATWCTGTSARSAGGIRLQFGREAKIRAALHASHHFESFSEKYGIDPDLKRHGYLILSSNRSSRDRLREAVALQNRLGLPSRFLSPDEVLDVVPALETGDLLGATFSLSDGYLDPHALVQGFIRRFLDGGGILKTSSPVLDFVMIRDRVTGVRTAGGVLHADAVVVAAGPFAGPLLVRAGVNLPLRPCRRQIFFTGPVAGVDAQWPLVLDLDNSFYFRPETGGVIMSLAEEEEMEPPASGNDIALKRHNLDELARRATMRCPILESAEVRGGWAGLRTLTPDQFPLLGPIPSLSGLFVAAGFSGHGVTLSPFAASVLTADLTGGEGPLGDLSAFRPARFLTA